MAGLKDNRRLARRRVTHSREQPHAMRVLRRCVLLVALIQQRDLVSAFAPAPQVHVHKVAQLVPAVGLCASRLAVEAPGRASGGRCALRLQMRSGSGAASGSEATAGQAVEGPSLGRRPTGPDPFAVVHGDMKRIKAKIKRLADNAMSSSSACPVSVPERATPCCARCRRALPPAPRH